MSDTPDTERRKDSDMRRLFERIEHQQEVINTLVNRVEVYTATRDMEIAAIKEEQREINANQQCILRHLNKFQSYMWAGSIVVLVVVGAGKLALWALENISVLGDMIKKD